MYPFLGTQARCKHESASGMCLTVYRSDFYTRKEAQDACVREKGTLVEENLGDVRSMLRTLIHDPVEMGDSTAFWTGGVVEPASGWKWANGSMLSTSYKYIILLISPIATSHCCYDVGSRAGEWGQWNPMAAIENEDSFDEVICVRIAPDQRYEWQAVNCGNKNAALCHVG